jgi:hypothetical protein
MDIQKLTLPQIEYEITVAKKALSDCQIRVKNYPKSKMDKAFSEVDGFKKKYADLQQAMLSRYRKN